MFVKPLEEQEPFGTFLSHIQAQELGASSSAAEDSLVRYAQTRMWLLPSAISVSVRPRLFSRLNITLLHHRERQSAL